MGKKKKSGSQQANLHSLEVSTLERPGSHDIDGPGAADALVVSAAAAAANPENEDGGSGATPFPIVGIGASAGGLDAFTHLLRPMPSDSGMAFVLIQHLEPNRDSQLAELLARVTSMPVTEISDGMEVAPNHVYIIPPNTCMVLSGGRLRLAPRTSSPGLNLPIDHFMKSLAAEQKSRAIGVVLSGTASDGTLGLEAIKAEGGITFAQDESSAKYSSMPLSAIAAGCVDFVLAPADIAGELVRLGRHPYVQQPDTDRAEVMAAAGPDSMDRVFELLKARSGNDFVQYKDATIKRRILRRMALHKVESLEQYVQYLQETPAEVQSLYQDILIHVTGFFRDSEMFQALKDQVLPALLQGRAPDTPVRVWVPGCSSGEEAYSIAICLLEVLGDRVTRFPIQVFATDISEAEIDRARAGVYPESIKLDVSPERLQRYFNPVKGVGYQVNRVVRAACVFARQNMLSDPPFSQLDLISCRNVMIYLGVPLQKRAMGIFHYALKPAGFLILGAAETVSAAAELFTVLDNKARIHVRKATTARSHFSFGSQGKVRANQERPAAAQPAAPFDSADRAILDHLAPVGVVVDSSMQILQYRGQTGSYMEHVPGEATLNLLKAARKGLRVALRAAIIQAGQDNKPIHLDRIPYTYDGLARETSIEVVPVPTPAGQEAQFAVLFRDVTRTGAPGGDAGGAAKHASADERFGLLEQELSTAREHLLTMTEMQEATTEEMLSHNEELQSINEELETAKEELQATNEELHTLNEELGGRNQELGEVNDDLTNLIRSVNIPIVMVDKELKIRRFTPLAENVLHLIPGDLGRPISDIKTRIDFPHLQQVLRHAMATGSATERDVQDEAGQWYSLRVLPYYSQEGAVTGAVVALLDITQLKRSVGLIEQARNYAQAIVETVGVPLVVLDSELRVQTANQSFYDHFQVSRVATEGHCFRELGSGQWNVPSLLAQLEEILPGGTELKPLELQCDCPHLGSRSMVLSARSIQHLSNQAQLILLAIEDVTDRRRTEQEREQLDRQLQQAQKLESLGVLAGGIAHDFNNLLMAMMGHASLVLMKLPKESPARPGVEQIEKAVERAAELTNQMLAYSGKGSFVIQPLDLSRLVEEMAHLLDAAISKKAMLRYDFEPGLPAVEADATQLRQVVMNLITNASDAIGDRSGIIQLSTGRRRAREVQQAALTRSFFNPAAPAEQYVYVEVSDTGNGMDAGTLAKMFDPFFTTKFTGRGLGLAAVLGIIRGHCGAIDIKSAPGKGTTIRVLFPGTAQPAAPVTARIEVTPAQPDWRGSGMILVVDDEEEVRMVTRMILEEFGYTVLTADNGREGVRIFQAEADHIAAVLLDMTMPEMNGEETFHAIRRIKADARVLLCSGYNEQDVTGKFTGTGLDGFLQKPYTPIMLLAKLAEALSPASSPAA